MNVAKGKFIVFEGVNGCGKTTQQDILYKELEKDGIKFVTTNEPSNFPIGNCLIKHYLSGEYICDHKMITTLFAMDRYHQAIDPKSGIIEILNNGFNVIQSRTFLSSMALEYNKIKDLSVLKEVYNANIDVINIYQKYDIHPNIIFIDVKPETCIERQKVMEGHIDDIHEKSDFIVGQRDAYLAALGFLMNYSDLFKIIIVDGNDSLENVHNRIHDIVYPLLNE